MNKIWNKLIQKKKFIRIKSKQNFYHLNTLEMYKKISSLKLLIENDLFCSLLIQVKIFFNFSFFIKFNY